MFLEMPMKDDVSWSTMIVGFAHNGYFEEAFSFFRELQRKGMRPNETSLTGVLSACAQAGALEFGKILHGFIEKSGLAWIVSVNNALLDTYSKCGNVLMAQLVFERIMNERNIVSWTSMMAALAMHGHGEEAIGIFHKMEESGIRPDEIAFISLLYACSHAGLVEQGCEYFDKMKGMYNIEPSIEHYGCMVNLYGQAGQLQKAYMNLFVKCQFPESQLFGGHIKPSLLLFFCHCTFPKQS
jgi:pentatricopeptide repeat protein